MALLNSNCSICEMKQNHHFIVPKEKFELLSGDRIGELTTYTFHTRQAKHTFCSKCGVQSFYIPRSNQNGYGIMPHCITSNTLKKPYKIMSFNGINYENEMKGEKFARVQSFTKI